MFKIFYDTLARPREIVNHVDNKSKGKFIGFIILLILLLVIPYFISQIEAYNFSSEEARNVSYYMLDSEPVEYEIKDGRLSYTGSGDPVVSNVKVDKDTILLIDLPVYFVFSLDGSNYDVNKENAYIILFKETEIEILYRPFIEVENDGSGNGDKIQLSSSIYDEMYPKEEQSLKTFSYGDLNINLNYNEGFKDEYYLRIYNIGSLIYNEIKWDLILDTAVFTVLVNVVSFFMNVLFTAVIFKFLFRVLGLNFKTILKIAILCSTIYVVGFVIGYLYNLQLVSLVCEFLSMIYTYRVMKQYAILKLTKNTGGN